MISRVPAVTYAVSLARARRYHTPLGAVSVHHVTPGFFKVKGRISRQLAPLMSRPTRKIAGSIYHRHVTGELPGPETIPAGKSLLFGRTAEAHLEPPSFGPLPCSDPGTLAA